MGVGNIRQGVVLVGSVCLVLASAGGARAEASKNDRSLAQSLFDEAKRLMASGDYGHACPKLEESQRLDPGGGTLLNLALCHEKQGNIATAWTEFKEALSAAKRDGRAERAAGAQDHIDALEPKLPWLTLNVASPADAEDVKLDGASIGKAAWGSPLSIDPGKHELKATAPGRQLWSSSFTIAIAEKQSATVPELAAAPSAAVSTPTPPSVPPSTSTEPASNTEEKPAPATKSEGSSSQRTLGWVIGGAGVVAAGVGAYFGIDTLQKKKASDEECPSDDRCSKRGVELNDQAHTEAWVSDLGIGLGAAGMGVGAFLLLTAGSAEPAPQQSSRVRLDASSLPGGGQLRLRGSF